MLLLGLMHLILKFFSEETFIYSVCVNVYVFMCECTCVPLFVEARGLILFLAFSISYFEISLLCEYGIYNLARMAAH